MPMQTPQTVYFCLCGICFVRKGCLFALENDLIGDHGAKVVWGGSFICCSGLDDRDDEDAAGDTKPGWWPLRLFTELSSPRGSLIASPNALFATREKGFVYRVYWSSLADPSFFWMPCNLKKVGKISRALHSGILQSNQYKESLGRTLPLWGKARLFLSQAFSFKAADSIPACCLSVLSL